MALTTQARVLMDLGRPEEAMTVVLDAIDLYHRLDIAHAS
jgi:hypothetical protein